MDLQPVRDAYARMSEQYIALVDGDVQEHEDDRAFVARHLAGLTGRVLDLGCGPGHWSGYLHALGIETIGVDLVPEFIAHARERHPGPDFRLGSMTALDLPDNCAAGILSWYSTIHVPPAELDPVLAQFRRLLAPGGTLVAGFFASVDVVAEFDHKVVAAYRWPVDVFAQRLARAGLTEVGRLQRQVPDRPDRRYAAVAARAE